MQISGLVYLLGYIILLGVGTFFQKLSLKELTPYQLHFLISIGMITTAIPILYFPQKSFRLPLNDVPVGSIVGFLFAIGSFLFTLSLTRLPAGVATAISLSYVIIVAVLSAVFLKEPFTPVKVVGVLLTLVGIGLLSLQTSHEK